MKPRAIFTKTMPFVWAKLLLGLATVAISLVVFAILMGIALLIKNENLFAVMFMIWLFATGIVHFALMRYVGYLVKAGHVAVITEAVTTGRVPDNQVAYGKQMVKDRFLTSNVYFVIDRLVAGAVRQLQRILEKAGNLLGFVPGMKTIVSIGKMFIGIALGYIDECCLGYTFYKKDQGAFKSAADGVVIYAQNWKKLLKDAAKTTAVVVILQAVITLVVFVLFMLLFNLLGWNLIVAFLISFFAALAIKSAFIDSYMMVKMMVSYMEVAPATEITYDLYGKLCGMSGKFRQLFGKAKEENPQLANEPVYATAGGPSFGGGFGSGFGRSGSSFRSGLGSAFKTAFNTSNDTAPAAPQQQQPFTPSQPQQPQQQQPFSQQPYSQQPYSQQQQQQPFTPSQPQQPQQPQQPGAGGDSRFCGNCGSMNKGASKFCGSCGQPM